MHNKSEKSGRNFISQKYLITAEMYLYSDTTREILMKARHASREECNGF